MILDFRLEKATMKILKLFVELQIISLRLIIKFYKILLREMLKHLPYNEKIDIWAFGCIIHHMATGFNPFEVNNIILNK